MYKEHQSIRKELWVGIAVAVAQSSNSVESQTCWIWADKILAEFDSRFRDESNQQSKPL